MLPAPRSYRLPALAIGVLLAFGAAMLVAFSSTADARTAAASTSSLGFTTPTPTLTGTPTPTATPIPGYPQMTDIVCNPTLTADSARVELLDEVTFTFDAGCACSGDFDCGYYAWSANLTSGGFALTEPFGNPPPTSFTATAVNPGVLDITVTYFGEKQVGSLYFTGTLAATTQVTVEPVPIISPTPTPTPTLPGEVPLVIDPGATLACTADAGTITWNDVGKSKYWIYRSVDDGQTYSWLGRTTGATTFTDPYPVVGAEYQVRYAGAAPFACDVISQPSDPQPPFTCDVVGDTITWTDDAQTKYWVYRSVDDGETYSWLGRTFGATTFTDPSPVDGALYQVHYAGIPRVDCTTGAQAYLQFDFVAPTGSVHGADEIPWMNDMSVTVTGSETRTYLTATATVPGIDSVIIIQGTCADFVDEFPEAYDCTETTRTLTTSDGNILASVDPYTDDAMLPVPDVDFYVFTESESDSGCVWEGGGGLLPANQQIVTVTFGLACP